MPRRSRRGRHAASRGFPVVGVGASAGGLAAFSELLRALPPKPGMAFVIISHLDPQHGSILDALLAKQSKMPIRLAVHATVLKPNHIYVVTPGKSVTIQNGALRTVRRESPHGKPNVIDLFFASLAKDQRSRARAVVLSGIGSDGTEGLKLVRLEGGATFAQDPRTAQFDSMPANAIQAGVDFVLSPAKIAERLLHLGRRRVAAGELEVARAVGAADDHGPYGEILTALLKVTGTDFSQYRQTTLRRRIARRMALKHYESLESYARHVEQDIEETRLLYADFLIHVSSFFRDTGAFRALERKVLRELVARRRNSDPIRVWVSGCSKGEEVYSIGMLLLEQLGRRLRRRRVQLFGTDISATEIDIARAGRYPASIAADVGARRLKRFFSEVPGGYQVNRELRELCVFACQDVASDPPFSKLDLISCRNLLMYFTRPLQTRVIGTFHYVLKPNGYLMLGRSESIAGNAELFALLDRKHRIYVRRAAATWPLLRPARTLTPAARPLLGAQPAGVRADLRTELDRMLVERYAPPGFFVDEDLQILSFQGDARAYLQPAPGQATLQLGRMVSPGTALDIRTAMRAARKSRKAVHRETAMLTPEGVSHPLGIVVIPVAANENRPRGYLVLFERRAGALAERRSEQAPVGQKGRGVLVRTRKMLEAAREQMQTIVEEKDSTEQELRTAHEEVLSSNEELQSSNEELETGKEELQSANEELTTVNEELQKRNEDLDRLTSELGNLIAGVNIPIVNLSRDRRVLRFSPAAGAAFNLIQADIGRSFSHIKPPALAPDLDDLITLALRRGSNIEREVQDPTGRWHSLRLRPYRATDSRIEGVLITLVDIDAAKRRAAAVVESIREPLLVLDAEFRVLAANPAFLQTFRVSATEVEGRMLFKLGQGQWDLPELHKLVESVLPHHKRFEGMRLDYNQPGMGRKIFLLNGQQIVDEGAGTNTILLVFLDVTEREAAAHELRALTARLRESAEQQDKRVAHELHDLSSEGLAGLSIELARQEKLLTSSPAEAAKGLRAARQVVHKLAQSTHELARRLHPSVLEDLGLARALRAECQAFRERHGIAIDCRARLVPPDLPEPVTLCVYRVAQEALRNVARHASAKRVGVVLTATRYKLAFVVRDNGTGFNVKAVRARGGLGLVSMAERVAAVGGSFEVKSAPGSGTTITVEIPLGHEGQ